MRSPGPLKLVALVCGALVAGCTCCPKPPKDATPLLKPDGTAVFEERERTFGDALQCPVWGIAGCEPGELSGCSVVQYRPDKDNGRPVVDDNGRPIVDDNNGCQKYAGMCAPMPDNGRPVVDDTFEDNGRPVVDDIGCQYFEGDVCPVAPESGIPLFVGDTCDGVACDRPETDDLGCQAFEGTACPQAPTDRIPETDGAGVIMTDGNGCPLYDPPLLPGSACPKAPADGIPIVREGKPVLDAKGCLVFAGSACAVAPDKGTPNAVPAFRCPTYKLTSNDFCPPAPDNGRPIVDDTGRPIVDDATGCLLYQGKTCSSAPDNGRPIVDDNGRPVVDDSGCQVYSMDVPVPAPICAACDWCACP